MDAFAQCGRGHADAATLLVEAGAEVDARIDMVGGGQVGGNALGRHVLTLLARLGEHSTAVCMP